jgi:hypothetical protein
LSKNDFTAEAQRTQRKKFFRIPEKGILKKLTSIEKCISVFARPVPMGCVTSGEGFLDCLFPLLREKDNKKLSVLCASRERSERAVK